MPESEPLNTHSVYVVDDDREVVGDDAVLTPHDEVTHLARHVLPIAALQLVLDDDVPVPAEDLLGAGARWDKASGRFHVPLTDLLLNGDPKPGLITDKETITRARELRANRPAEARDSAPGEGRGGDPRQDRGDRSERQRT